MSTGQLPRSLVRQRAVAAVRSGCEAAVNIRCEAAVLSRCKQGAMAPRIDFLSQTTRSLVGLCEWVSGAKWTESGVLLLTSSYYLLVTTANPLLLTSYF